MAQATCTFETGVNGNNVLTSDTGSATAWDSVSAFVGNTITYSNTHAYGTLSGKFDNSSNNASATVATWTTGIGTLTDWYGRIYLYCTANPASTKTLRLYNGGGNASGFRIRDDGTVMAIDAGSALAVATTNAISLNQWVRIEWHLIHSTTVGQWEIKLFNSPDSSTATETATSSANLNTGTNSTEADFGLIDGGGQSATIWLDNIVAGATSYPGPVATSTATAIYLYWTRAKARRGRRFTTLAK